MKKTGFIQKAIFGLLLILLLFGCAGKKEKGLKTIQGDPEVLYKQNLVLFNKKEYKAALEKFEQLKSSFPDSPPYTLWAELKIADCHFFLRQYVEAAAAYEEFRKIHPTYEEVTYVQFQIGMSYFNQMTTFDRDQTFTKKALASFEYLVANYSLNLFTEKAKDKIGICKRQLADHEFYIGDFYYRQEKFQAAVSRFEGLLEKFPRWLDEDKTLLYIGKSYIGLNQEERAKETLKRLVNDYPRSPYTKEAKTILSKGLKVKKASRKAIEVKKGKGKKSEPESEGLILVKYEEEGKRAVSLKEKTPTPLTSTPMEEERPKAIPETQKGEKAPAAPATVPMEEEEKKTTPEPKQVEEKTELLPSFSPEEERAKSVPPAPSEDLKIALIPVEESSKSLSLPKAEPKREGKSEGKKQKVSLPDILAPSIEREKPPKETQKAPPQEAKIIDAAQPIDIVSDSVETYTKENLILFKGNVMARQKDIVIYADSLEAVIIEDGKGIERVVAGGNVKVQQGIRVANCERAVFYNLEKKVVLTGDPKIREGDNIVSGEEIVFDIDRDRIEVKGGTSDRGKVKIYPKEETEKKE
ncbi:MAG: lipopolysaccharide transport periplasmic protein LptA [Deltaproteobacteria bacterium RBG_16_48_10]|nr:MAG: lipopolysaccharide transport periplasmic protein LptA [Deltaproteobacteria bacterium RBG_16_48_10]